jgi:glyceraldehyde-3-phosphate dehydrogenase (NADP+)
MLWWSQIFLPDLFEGAEGDVPKNSFLDVAIEEALLGALSYNGQRCTALKLLLVPRQHAERFGQALAQRLEQEWTVGLPWQRYDDSSYPKITPLPNHDRVEYMQRLIHDAVDKGAKILNSQGGTIVGQLPESTTSSTSSSTLMVPAILYPVTPDMDVYQQEQFGPVVPIVPYDDLEEVIKLAQIGPYGQQVSVFTSSLTSSDASSEASKDVTNMLDRFATIFGKINLNQQCGRSPDTLPFSGRRSSAQGVMSVQYALQEFSVPVVVAYKDHHSVTSAGNQQMDFSEKLQASSKFLE